MKILRMVLITLILSICFSCSDYGDYSSYNDSGNYVETLPTPASISVETPSAPSEEQPEVLTRGPVHEAFAEPVDLQLQAGVIAPVAPPENINEYPSMEKPVGAEFVWVPGYWAWDSERTAYIWVSGCWRAAPPNMYWVPGYWAAVSGGWEWVAGFWSPVIEARQIEYLPAPPPLYDVEPPYAPPSANVIWVPPCWYWSASRYVWRPGYWLAARTDWIWVPSHYIWTPRGYIFVRGHWDYPLSRRGCLFAPVYFARPVYRRPGFYFSASIVIDIGNLQFSLFTRPSYCHYYFGDYYDDSYISIGIYPWYQCVQRWTWYDPIYQHQRWSYRRTQPRWEEHIRTEFDRRRTNVELRPARTYSEQQTRIAKLPQQERRQVKIAEPISTYTKERTTPIKFERINEKTRERLSTQTEDISKFRRERNRWESQPPAEKELKPTEKQIPVIKPGTKEEKAEKEKIVTVTEPEKGEKTPIKEKIVTEPQRGEKTPVKEKPVTITEPKRGEKTPVKEQPVTIKEPQRGEKATGKTERKAEFAPPRQVKTKQPEKVTVPKPPIEGSKSGGIGGMFQRGQPSRPANEQKFETKERGRGQEKPKETPAAKEKTPAKEEEKRKESSGRGKKNE